MKKPCQLEYCEVVYSMCEVLSLIYFKFLDCTDVSTTDAIVKLDEKIHVLFNIIFFPLCEFIIIIVFTIT